MHPDIHAYNAAFDANDRAFQYSSPAPSTLRLART